MRYAFDRHRRQVYSIWYTKYYIRVVCAYIYIYMSYIPINSVFE